MSNETNAVFNSESLNPSQERIVVPVVEEQVIINKKVVDIAKVNIFKKVYEDIESVSIPLTEERYSVERIAKNEFLNTTTPGVRYEGDVMIIPVLKEVAVVEKRMMLIEELRVTKYKTERTETHEVALRKEQVEVNRIQLDNP